MDAVVFVFSLENEASFNAVYNFYTKMANFRNSSEIPIILVGTQGKKLHFIFKKKFVQRACFSRFGLVGKFPID